MFQRRKLRKAAEKVLDAHKTQDWRSTHNNLLKPEVERLATSPKPEERLALARNIRHFKIQSDKNEVKRFAILKKLIEDKDPKVRYEAIRSLGQTYDDHLQIHAGKLMNDVWMKHSIEISSLLKDIIEKDQDPKVRRLASISLRQVVGRRDDWGM